MRIKEAAFLVLLPTVFAVAFSVSFFEIFSSLFIILSLIAFCRAEDKRDLRSAFVCCVLVYFFMNLLSVMQSDYRWVSARGVFKVFRQVLLCFSVIFILDSEDKIKKIMQWVLIVGVLIGVDALVQGWMGREFLRGRSMTPFLTGIGRLTGPFHHANDFSAYLIPLFFMFLGLLTALGSFFSARRKSFYWAGFFITAACLLGSYSRGAWVAVILTWGLAVFLKRSRLLAAMLLVVVVAGTLFMPLPVKIRLASFFEKNRGSLVERQVLWGESIRMVQERPWTGLGVNTYARNEQRYKLQDSKTDFQYAHNGYLQMAAEIGLPGLGSFLALLVVFFWGAWPVLIRSQNDFLRSGGTGIVLGVLAFLIHSATDTNLHSLLLINWFWIVLGMTWAVRNQALREKAAG